MHVLKHYESFYEAIHPAAENNDEAYAWFSDIPHPLFNAVMHLSVPNPAEKIEALIEKAPAGNPISFWVHSENRTERMVDILQEKGFAPIVTCPLMSWAVESVSMQEVDIRPAERAVFNQISSEAFHFDPVTKEKYGNLLAQLDAEKFLIFWEDVPVGTGILFASGEVGGIFNIAVLPEYYGKGLAKAMTRYLMKRAKELGLKQVVLLSSPDVETLYSSLGFKKIMDIKIYIHK